jgi:hypothetical protein
MRWVGHVAWMGKDSVYVIGRKPRKKGTTNMTKT